MSWRIDILQHSWSIGVMVGWLCVILPLLLALRVIMTFQLLLSPYVHEWRLMVLVTKRIVPGKMLLWLVIIPFGTNLRKSIRLWLIVSSSMINMCWVTIVLTLRSSFILCVVQWLLHVFSMNLTVYILLLIRHPLCDRRFPCLRHRFVFIFCVLISMASFLFPTCSILISAVLQGYSLLLCEWTLMVLLLLLAHARCLVG